MNLPEDEPKREKTRILPVQEEDEADLLDYIEVMVRWRWLIFWGVVICALGSYLYTFWQLEVYRAEAVILPGEEQNYLTLGKDRRQRAKQSLYRDILQSMPVNREVIQKVYQYTLDGKEYTTNLLDYFGVKTLQQSAELLLEDVDFTSRWGSITIAVETRSAELSAAVANEYIAQLMRYKRDKRQKQTQEQLAFIKQRMSEIQGELSRAEEALAEFRRRNRNLMSDGMAAFLAPESSTTYSRLQRDVQIRSSLLSTILNQYEVARLEAKKEVPDIEVISYAEPPEISAKVGTTTKVVGFGAAAGLLVSMLLAFCLEYIERNRQSGRMEPILEELRKDAERVRWLFGKKA